MAASACDGCRRVFLRGSHSDDELAPAPAVTCPVCGGRLRETCDSCRTLRREQTAPVCPGCGGALREATAHEVRSHVRRLRTEARERQGS